MGLDLLKVQERRQTVLNLKKDAGIEGQRAEVVLLLDFSGSMRPLYSNGIVQQTVERILPLGLGFDQNGSVDAYIFENNYKELPEPITLKNLDGYVNDKIIGKYRMAGTSFAPVLNAVYNKYVKTSGGGFWGGSKKVETMEFPIYIIMISDGENDDYKETEEIVREMSKAGFFIQFVGIGNENFKFLTKLDDLKNRLIDNANFFKVPDLSKISDDDLYKLLMKEYPEWSKQAKSLNLIK